MLILDAFKYNPESDYFSAALTISRSINQYTNQGFQKRLKMFCYIWFLRGQVKLHGKTLCYVVPFAFLGVKLYILTRFHTEQDISHCFVHLLK